MYGHPLKKAVKNEASGNFGHALLTISECATYPPKYFAKIHYALHVHVIFENFEFGLILELPKVYWSRGESPLAMKDAYRPGAF
ncbi:annexin D5 [Trifolium repens]|nr:annexin D5 [Trifolium repens]